MKNTVFSILCFIVADGFSQGPTNRVALVMGVQNYVSVSPLRNSLNDAHDMAAVLKSKNFQVIELYDPRTKRDIQDAIRKYFDLLQSKANAIGMVYYSGHGMQVDGSNYLIPTHADPKIKADLDDQFLNIDYMMQAIEQVGNSLNICVLDACRNNPFRSFSRSAEKGLSMVNTPRGSYIVYATKPGSVASDGTGRNGLFTSKLLKYINAEGLNIEQVFKRVAAEVSAESNDAQRPWIASDFTGDFFFTPGKGDTLNALPVITFSTPQVPAHDPDSYRDSPSKAASTLHDRIITHGGDTISCKVTELIDRKIKYRLDGEDLLNSVSENLVKEIRFSNGKIQEISQHIIVKGVEDWEKVQVTYEKSDVDGLVKKKELTAKSSAVLGYSGQGKMEKKAIEKLKKEAAALGCHVVLILTSTGRGGGLSTFGGTAKANLTGVAYSY